jgi:hypothetical protein
MTGYGDRANACFVSLTTDGQDLGGEPTGRDRGLRTFLATHCSDGCIRVRPVMKIKFIPCARRLGWDTRTMARRAAKRRISDIQQEDMTLHRYGDGTGVWDFGRRGRR